MKPFELKRAGHPARSRRLSAGAVGVAALVALLSAGLAAGAEAAATAVSLGTAGNFAVLGGSGLTNTGVTTVNGDVGTYPTPAETGFTACPASNCVALTGTNYGGGGLAPAAKRALTTAYNQTAAEGPTKAISAPLGGGQTLYAGVYNSGSSVQLNGSLTLNGRGNPKSVFVFQAGSSLTTATSSSVNLVNGAQACNVIWKVGSSATLNTSSNFAGTILAFKDISLGATVTVAGRLLAGEQASGDGAVTLIHDTITTPACATPPTTTTTVATHHRRHHKKTTGTTTPASGTIPASRIPNGAPQTGGGSTAGTKDMGLLALGAVLLVGGAGALVYRRRHALR